MHPKVKLERVAAIKHEIENSTYLLNDQERVRSFLKEAPLVHKLMRQQSKLLQSRVHFLIHEHLISSAALLIGIALNAMYVLGVESDAVWDTLGAIHLLLAVLVFFSYLANNISVDKCRYECGLCSIFLCN